MTRVGATARYFLSRRASAHQAVMAVCACSLAQDCLNIACQLPSIHMTPPPLISQGAGRGGRAGQHISYIHLGQWVCALLEQWMRRACVSQKLSECARVAKKCLALARTPACRTLQPATSTGGHQNAWCAYLGVQGLSYLCQPLHQPLHRSHDHRRHSYCVIIGCGRRYHLGAHRLGAGKETREHHHRLG
jgi:hypothetical protein